MKLATKIFRRSDWYVTSSYGWRNCPFHGREHHNGTDYGTHVKNWPLYAIEDGYVQLVTKSNSGYGNRVWVRYPRINKSLMHAHMKDISVKKGDKVKEGTLLGHAGKTGSATGIHLHLGMTDIGKDAWQNPHAYEYIEPKKDNVTNPVNRDENKDQLKVLATQLRCRKEPNLKGSIIGIVQTGKYYNYYESKTSDGYTWYRIADNQWIATNGKYLEILPKKEPQPTPPTPQPDYLKVGDKVKIMKSGNANASGTGKKAGGIGWTRYIKKIHNGKAYPYQVGNSTGTTGFYKESSLQKL